MRGLIVEWPMVSLVALREAVVLNDTNARARIIKIYGFIELSLPAACAGVSSIIMPYFTFDPSIYPCWSISGSGSALFPIQPLHNATVLDFFQDRCIDEVIGVEAVGLRAGFRELIDDALDPGGRRVGDNQQ